MQGAGDAAILAIMDERNCGWVHHEGCHRMAEGGRGRMIGILYLLRYEGYANVMEFVREMAEHLGSVTEYVNDVNKAFVYLHRASMYWEKP